MQTLTRQVVEHGLTNHVLNDAQLGRLIHGSDSRRYQLVNRALKAGELVRLRRGTYVLNARLRDYPVHPFALAQAVVPGSYVSFETALAFHGWIPEAVYTTASVTPARKTVTHEHRELGSFAFHPLATTPGYFLELVERRQLDRQAALVAMPPRALMDLMCLRKVDWPGLAFLTEGMRIDYEHLRTITSADIRTLERVYRHKRMKRFLYSLAKELGND